MPGKQAKPLVVLKGFASDLKKGVTLLLNAARLDSASINLPHGVAPDSDHIADGDLWSTTLGFYGRVNGHTVGPFIDAASVPTLPQTTMTLPLSLAPTAVCFAIDVSVDATGSTLLDQDKAAVNAVLDLLAATTISTLDVCAIAWGYSAHATTSITKRSANAADIAAVQAWVSALVPSATNTDPNDALSAAKTFFDATDAGITNRPVFVLTDGDITDTANAATIAAAAAAVTASMTGVSVYAICIHDIGGSSLTYMAEYDNTPADGVPIAETTAALTAILERDLFDLAVGPGYFYSSGGAAKVRVASATTGDPTDPAYRPCNCWIGTFGVAGSVVYVPGQFVASSGLSPGATYWLAAGGGITTTAPGAAGNLDQVAGFADDTGNRLFFAPQRGIGV